MKQEITGWQWHQTDHVQIIYDHASTSSLNFFTDQMHFLTPNQHCQSTECMFNKTMKGYKMQSKMWKLTTVPSFSWHLTLLPELPKLGGQLHQSTTNGDNWSKCFASINQPTLSKHWRKLKHWPQSAQITHWIPCPDLTSEGRDVVPFTLVLWHQYLWRCYPWPKILVQCDLRAYNLSPNEAVDLAQNRPPWRLMSTYGGTHS